MNRLKEPHITPPGGWRFVDPDTQHPYREGYRSIDQLLSHIKTYRAQNKLDPIPKLRTAVECWLCEQPNMQPHCLDASSSRTVGQYLNGARAGAQLALERASSMMGLSKSPFTSQKLAEKRAATCVRCKYNVENGDHSRTRKYSDEFVAGIVGPRETSQDGELFSCSICSCPLRPKVHIGNRIIQERMNPHERYRFPNGAPGKDGKPLYCWQVRPITEEDANAEDQNDL